MGEQSLRFQDVYAWPNLARAAERAARGKRARPAVARFEMRWADELLGLQGELRQGRYRPGAYTHFTVHEPKRRVISAAPFRDRVVHHALCQIIEPWFEHRFIGDSYANRVGKGTHRAVDRCQAFARCYRYVLRLDIVKHFPAIDHRLLMVQLARAPMDAGLLDLCRRVVESGRGVLDDEYRPGYFPGDDLFAVQRPRGLPIGNLTSQFWSNVYLNPLDQFIKRRLRCRAYLRYVDDMLLFSDSKTELWAWKRAVVDRLLGLRLRVHAGQAQVSPVHIGIPWLGFQVYPTGRRLKSRNQRRCRAVARQAWREWRAGQLTEMEREAVLNGWRNVLRYADATGLEPELVGMRK